MTNDANEVSANALKDDLVGDWLEQADRRDRLQDRDHRVNRRPADSLVGQKTHKRGWNIRTSKSLQVAVTLLEQALKR